MSKELLNSNKINLIPFSVYFISLFFIPFVDQNGFAEHRGFFILFAGWTTLFYGSLVWLANPLFFIALSYWRQSKLAIICLLMSLGLILAFILGVKVRWGWGDTSYSKLLPGFYLWTSSYVLLLILSIARIDANVPSSEHTKSDQ